MTGMVLQLMFLLWLKQTMNMRFLLFYAKQETGETQKLDLSVQYVGDDESTHYDSITSVELLDSTWTKCEATMKVPEHTGTISDLLAVCVPIQ